MTIFFMMIRWLRFRSSSCQNPDMKQPLADQGAKRYMFFEEGHGEKKTFINLTKM
jgi:hypothetical protein